MKIENKEGETTITLNVAGCSSKDLNVEIRGDYLIVETENGLQPFVKRFFLYDTADCDGITAEVKNGVLTLVVPSKKDSVKRIEVA